MRATRSHADHLVERVIHRVWLENATRWLAIKAR
jgi:hypothetical protein